MLVVCDAQGLLQGDIMNGALVVSCVDIMNDALVVSCSISVAHKSAAMSLAQASESHRMTPAFMESM